jgi:hypothetical protein
MIEHNPLLPKNAVTLFIPGPVGQLDCLRLDPSSTNGGGTYTNKIVQTLARFLNSRGYICFCPNLRGVGRSEGEHDYGRGEVGDAVAIHRYVTTLYPDLLLVVAGFSFGCAIASALAKQVEHHKLILVAPAVTRYTIYVPDRTKTLVIHGEDDEIISLNDAFLWAKQHDQSIIWFPNTTHFFHGKLVNLTNVLNNFAI